MYRTLDNVQIDERVDFDSEYPVTNCCISLKIWRCGERKAGTDQERTHAAESRCTGRTRLNDAVIEDLKRLQEKVKPLNNQINIQMIWSLRLFNMKACLTFSF